MKARFLFSILSASLMLALATGCKHAPKGTTPIPGSKAAAPVDNGAPRNPVNPGPGNGLGNSGLGNGNGDNVTKTSTTIPETGNGVGTAGLGLFEGMIMDTNVFKANTIYFDFDKATVKKSEQTKIEEVVAYLKGTPQNKLLIEGHCDERGTEQYNLALGEHRALSAREYAVHSGISADRIRTISYGEARPAVQGHDEAAFSKNRRGEFILLKPAPEGAAK